MTKTYNELLREARASVREVSAAEAEALAAQGARVVDVRESPEWEEGHLPAPCTSPRAIWSSA